MRSHKFQKTKLIVKKLHKIRKNENVSRLKKEEDKNNLTELSKELNKHEKYCDHDDRVKAIKFGGFWGEIESKI